MKFTLDWLKDFLDTDATTDAITKTLTSIGLEVEQVIDHAAALAGFVVAEIQEALQHPSADKLKVCKVNDGEAIRQIVCGAPNARTGLKVVLAREGVIIPQNGMTIKKTAIRGVESNGMLCSAYELGIGEDGGGIIELPASAVPGARAAEALGLGGQTVEIAITPNRADCLGVYGIARDLAAAGLGRLKPLDAWMDEKGFTQHPASASAVAPVNVRLQTPACPLFIGCPIANVKNAPSPEWLQNRLKAIGLRPISALVDITNYMTFAYGRPLHVFDADRLQGSITVRSAVTGEKLKALNDKEYSLTDGMTVICDESGVIGLGGIIGGTSTSCSEATVNVLLEAAYFDPANIAATGRALQIESDARHRFERSIDPAFVEQGARLAARLIVALCGGDAGTLAIAGEAPRQLREIRFNPGKIATLGGITLPQEEASAILSKLGFGLSDDKAVPPSWRADVEGEADLVEEVLRIKGYDSIPSLALPAAHAKTALDPTARMQTLARRALAGAGLHEICSWAFMPLKTAKQFGGGKPELSLLNPISADLDAMRPSLLPNLLTALGRNAARGFTSLALFETGNVFKDTTPQGHILMCAGARSGDAVRRNPLGTARPVDAFDAKSDLFRVLETMGITPSKLLIDRETPAWYHPTRSGRISLGGKITLGFFGEIHPALLPEFDIKSRLAVFEVFLSAIPIPRNRQKAKPPLAVSNFQSTERDFAFIADTRTATSDIVKAIEGVEKQLIKSVDVFDTYSGKGMENGKKSVAVAVTLQAADRTLSEQEINNVSQKIITATARLGLTLRS